MHFVSICLNGLKKNRLQVAYKYEKQNKTRMIRFPFPVPWVNETFRSQLNSVKFSWFVPDRN